MSAAKESNAVGTRLFPDPGSPFVTCPCCGHAIVGVTQRQRGDAWTPAQDHFIQTARIRGATVKLIGWALGCPADLVVNRLMALRKMGR